MTRQSGVGVDRELTARVVAPWEARGILTKTVRRTRAVDHNALVCD